MEDVPIKDVVKRAELCPDGPEASLLLQVSEMSTELFHEDTVEAYGASGKAGRLTWLWADRSSIRKVPVDDAGSETSWCSESCAQEPVLIGFMVTKYLQPLKQKLKGGQALTIIYAAVAEEFRGRGIGKLLVKSAIQLGKSRRDVALVTLSSLPEAIDFYKRLGFIGFEKALSKQEGAAEGQLYMEYPTHKRR